MHPLDISILLFSLLGHTILWVGLVNRFHGCGFPRWVIQSSNVVCGVGLVAIPLFAIATGDSGWSAAHPMLPIRIYGVLCVGLALFGLVERGYWLLFAWRPPRCLIANHTEVLERICPPQSLLTRLPQNEALDLHIHTKALVLPGLPPQLDGFRIAHLSDLHMSGRIGKAFFERVVEHTVQADPDLVAITGDLFDRTHCLEWIPDTLAKLRSRYGQYFVLGNHDLRMDWQSTLQQLGGLGFVHLGGRWTTINVRGRRVVLAGNEAPWFGRTSDLDRTAPSSSPPSALQILLAHSPNPVRWARRHKFDLMLAGHNHGGQVCLPVVGPILAPSRQGTRYAAGVFESGPMKMHVSRGLSSLAPIRWNCPPELAILELRAE